MLKTRIISSIVGLVLFMTAMLIHDVAATVLIAAISVIAMIELLSALKTSGHNPVSTIGILSCAVILYGIISPDYRDPLLYMLAAVSTGLSLVMIFRHEKYSVADAALTLFAIAYIVFMFSFIARTRLMINGAHTVWIIFAGSWGADTAAYFTGRQYGRKKLLPEISPNKTVEGALGGLIGGIVFVMLIGIFIKPYVKDISWFDFASMGIICGLFSQLGDWTASLIKRFTGVKDFGKIIPGHGGVLDRFDSVMITAPLIYAYLKLIVRI